MSERREAGLEDVRSSLVNFDIEALHKAVLSAIESGLQVQAVINAMAEAMSIVGKKFEEGEYFVPELIMAGETMKEGVQALKPYMKGVSTSSMGTAVITTVKGDIHDIGKNIFVTLMTTAGFKVVDLGVDVSAERIVQAVKENDASILGLSALLTTNLEQFPLIMGKLREAGLGGRVKVIVGGATVTEDFAKQAGVDGYAKTALAGVEICKNWAKRDQAKQA
ncbi:corrinoid protein [Candidatus Bathyarchaeota archaeon]|nr:corrinoid protein [Candidatus Bathyarchaeota archaeon]